MTARMVLPAGLALRMLVDQFHRTTRGLEFAATLPE